MIEQEREAAHGDLEAETRPWLDKLAEVDRTRRLLPGDGRRRLDLLRRTQGASGRAQRDLDRCRARAAFSQAPPRVDIRQLEQDKETPLERYAAMLPEALDALGADECQRVKISTWR